MRAGHRPPLKLYAQFSRIQLSRRLALPRCNRRDQPNQVHQPVLAIQFGFRQLSPATVPPPPKSMRPNAPGFHLAVDTLPSGNRKRCLQVRLGCVQLSPSCPFRLLHTFLSPGPRGITPAFGYGAPHPSARGTSTLPINALLSAHYGPLGLPPGSARFQPSGLIRPVFARQGCQVGSLLFHIALSQRATAFDPGEVQQSFRSGLLSVAFAAI